MQYQKQTQETQPAYPQHWNPPYDHPINKTTWLLQLLFCVPNQKSSDVISLVLQPYLAGHPYYDHIFMVAILTSRGSTVLPYV